MANSWRDRNTGEGQDIDGFGISYPFVKCVGRASYFGGNGAQFNGGKGYYYVDADEFTKAPEGWTAGTLAPGGNSIDVYMHPHISLGIIGWRQYWSLNDRIITEWQDGANKPVIQVAGIVKELLTLDSEGKVVPESIKVWSIKYSGWSLTKGVKGVMRDMGNKILRPARKVSKINLPSYTFFVRITHGEPEVVNPDHPSTKVSLPSLYIPRPDQLEAYLDKADVGEAVAEFCASSYDEVQDWKAMERRQRSGSGSAQAESTSDEWVDPDEVEENDIPF